MKKILALIAVAAAGIGITACSSTHVTPAAQEQRATQAGLAQLLQSQPVPAFKWSQIREDLIEIEAAQAHTVQTTSFLFNQGVQNPIQSCPSIGFPVASTSQITNPQQLSLQRLIDQSGNYSDESGVLGQIDPNGIYSGDSTGTYVVCVSPSGEPYFNYWEGFVQTVTGPAVWDDASHSVKMTGPTTVQIKTH